MKKHLLSLIMVSAVVITSCSSEVPELMDFLGPQGEGADFGGVTVKISSEHITEGEDADSNKKAGVYTQIFYDTNTLLGDAVLNRTSDIVNYSDFGFMQNTASSDLQELFLRVFSHTQMLLRFLLRLIFFPIMTTCIIITMQIAVLSNLTE